MIKNKYFFINFYFDINDKNFIFLIKFLINYKIIYYN